jgi:glycosyltransferase involved in cell wall biosynthesis
MDNESKYIISAGDIVENQNILQIIEVFKKIDKETKVLIIGK